MTEDEAYKVHIQYTFNAFCKVVIRHAAIDIILKLRRRWEREVSLDYLMNEKFVQLAEPEQLEEYLFTACGQTAVLYHAYILAGHAAQRGDISSLPCSGYGGSWREKTMSKLLPYETIVKAHEGDPDAVNTVLSATPTSSCA